MNLLLIEDDRGISLALSQALNDYTVDIAYTGGDGLAKAAMDAYDVIVLDLHLPDISGLEVCKQLRLNDRGVPIIILSCETKVLSKIGLLDAGADDYLTKPFSLGELKVRLRVLLRRSHSQTPKQNSLRVEDLSLNSDQHLVERGGRQIKLRRKEFALLECLMQRAGMVVTREALCDYAWKGQEAPWSSTIDVHIKYLRDKIDRPFSNQLIKTVHGLGYKLDVAQLASERDKAAALR